MTSRTVKINDELSLIIYEGTSQVRVIDNISGKAYVLRADSIVNNDLDFTSFGAVSTSIDQVNSSIIPDTTETYDLGSATNRWRDLYLSGNTINLGGVTLSVSNGNLQVAGTDLITASGGVDYSQVQNKPTKLSDFTNDVGYITTNSENQTLSLNGNILSIANGNSVNLSSVVSSANPFDQDLNTTDTVTFDIAAATTSFVGKYTTVRQSSVFQNVVDTGLNIRSNPDGNPIYIYNYGSDGLGTGAGELDVTSSGVDIFANYGLAGQAKWQFKTILGNPVFQTPNMILGSVNSDDQLISLNSDHRLLLANSSATSYIQVNGNNVSTADDRHKILISSNGEGSGNDGSIILKAGDNNGDHYSMITMGDAGLIQYHDFPPLGDSTNDVLQTNVLISGGIFSAGDIVMPFGSVLGIRDHIVFQDGSQQKTAYNGTNIVGLEDEDITITTKDVVNRITIVNSDPDSFGTTLSYYYGSGGSPDVGTSAVANDGTWYIEGPALSYELPDGSGYTNRFPIIGVVQNPEETIIEIERYQFEVGRTYTLLKIVEKTTLLGTDGNLTIPGSITASSFDGDVTGSIFADNSTLLVDAVNGEIPGYVKIEDLKTALQDGAGDYAAFKAWVLANL